jgi:hypothetical protein
VGGACSRDRGGGNGGDPACHIFSFEIKKLGQFHSMGEGMFLSFFCCFEFFCFKIFDNLDATSWAADRWFFSKGWACFGEENSRAQDIRSSNVNQQDHHQQRGKKLFQGKMFQSTRGAFFMEKKRDTR